MLMPHHGSATSSQQSFLNKLNPALVIAQTGFANRYGFPKPAVLKRYQSMGVDVRNTANGALLLRWFEHSKPDMEVWQAHSLLRRELALTWWQSW